jgi:hypothetical protein
MKTDAEIEEFIREALEKNFEQLRLESGHSISADLKRTALNQALFYWRKLRDVAPSELELLNDLRHVVYGYGIPELDSHKTWELQDQFLRLHPDRFLTLDHLPLSVRLLDVYDRSHGTQYASKARLIFTQFVDAIILADKEENVYEKMALENFKEILNQGANHES